MSVNLLFFLKDRENREIARSFPLFLADNLLYKQKQHIIHLFIIKRRKLWEQE